MHQRVPIFMGDKNLVKKAEEYIHLYDQEWISYYRPYRDAVPDFEALSAVKDATTDDNIEETTA
jgi:hypothetical protein